MIDEKVSWKGQNDFHTQGLSSPQLTFKSPLDLFQKGKNEKKNANTQSCALKPTNTQICFYRISCTVILPKVCTLETLDLRT